MCTTSFENILEICRKEKVIFALGKLDRNVVNLDICNYNIYIINNKLPKSKINEIHQGIKEGNHGSYTKTI